ncbi:hypothetical protein SI65_10057 [Aspergillus cristatus]|uniref:Uncharacterized protein n=1 Tax=Aspergillus cristatus TaxID=573508 RepID=A0A1E3B153_ASPCR|nr:hypothetical protein SI65_10057 [Aspergillus cristatus]
MDLPFAKQEPIDSTGIILTADSPTPKAKDEPNDATTCTPRKRAHGKKVMMDGDNADEQEQGSPTKKSKAKYPGKKAGPFGPIPTSYEEIGPEDKLILRMKETEGKDWAEIKRALEEITGSKLGSSTNETSTPKKRVREKTQTTMGENESPTKKSKAKSPGKKAGLGPIPTSYDEASEEDKLIIKMREKDGQGWSDIRKVIEEITGVKFGGSSLSNRYGRMKANFTVFEKEDADYLLQAKKDIEGKMEHEKWQRIADAIEAKSGNKYPTPAVQKKFKELTKKVNGNGVVAAAVEEG